MGAFLVQEENENARIKRGRARRQKDGEGRYTELGFVDDALAYAKNPLPAPYDLN